MLTRIYMEEALHKVAFEILSLGRREGAGGGGEGEVFTCELIFVRGDAEEGESRFPLLLVHPPQPQFYLKASAEFVFDVLGASKTRENASLYHNSHFCRESFCLRH